ncbi:MAG: hypothetical protein H6779_00435 [Candidatus Nomurabacteria bacterium]|nr:MAG: hypothetical protein H6779_00435 [Candidatus Nomurabacteria bacterium]
MGINTDASDFIILLLSAVLGGSVIGFWFFLKDDRWLESKSLLQIRTSEDVGKATYECKYAGEAVIYVPKNDSEEVQFVQSITELIERVNHNHDNECFREDREQRVAEIERFLCKQMMVNYDYYIKHIKPKENEK